MKNQLEESAKRVIRDLKEVALFTSDENGAQRVAWTDTWIQARKWFREQAEAIGATVTTDSAGNVWTRLDGKTEEAVVVGSHLDSVPNGGWLDGILGVLSGLEALRIYSKTGQKPAKTIYVVDWADEEGARYGYSCLGSAAVSGSLALDELIGREDHNGIKFEEALKTFGVDAHNMLNAQQEIKEKTLVAYLELHIEQGPVLEQTNKEVSSVYGAAGVQRHYITFKGQAAHAGSFPTEMRQDAFLAAAQSALAFREVALKYDAVCTVGEVSVQPDVVTIVPGECRISLDQRTINPDNLQKMYEKAQEITKKAAADHGVEVEWKKIYSIQPVLFNDHLIELCKEAVKEETGEPTNMYSGPLHDAVEMAGLMPTVMMFVMSEKGISHAQEEDTPEDKLAVGIRAFLRLIDKVVND